MRSTTVRGVLVVLVLLLTAVSCSSAPEPSRGGAAIGPVQPASACPRGMRPLDLRPENAQEAAYVDQLTACGDLLASRTWIHNDSDAVWLVDAPTGLQRTAAGDVSLQTQAYRSFSAGWVAGLTVEPDTSVFISAAPGTPVHLTLDPVAQSLWETGDLLKDKAVEGGQSVVTDLIARDSPSRRAWVTCFAEAASFGSTVYDAYQDQAVTLRDALGLGGNVRSCSNAVGAAERDARVRGTSPAIEELALASEKAAAPQFVERAGPALRAAFRHVLAVIH